MYSSLKTAKVANFMDHFTKPNIFDIPGPDIPKHPLIKCIDINDWCQCKDFPNIFILGSDMKFFFCSSSKCNWWYAISNTFGNINQHMLHFYYGLFRYILIHHLNINYMMKINSEFGLPPDSINKLGIRRIYNTVFNLSLDERILSWGKLESLIRIIISSGGNGIIHKNNFELIDFVGIVPNYAIQFIGG